MLLRSQAVPDSRAAAVTLGGAVVLGSVPRPSLVCVRSLGAGGTAALVVDMGGPERPGPAALSRWAAGHVRLPTYFGQEEAGGAALQALVREHQPAVVIPTTDADVEMLRQQRRQLGGLTRLALADEAALTTMLDKRLTLAAAERIGLPVPEGVPVQDPADALAIARGVGYPVVVKPGSSWTPASWLTGRLVCRVAADAAELVAAVSDLLAVGGEPIVQSWLPGEREAVSLFVSEGRTRAAFAQVALRTTPPLGGTSVVRESIAMPADLREHAESLVHSCGYEGYAEVEFRRDARGVARLMEVNPRLSASVQVATAAGVDFPAYLHAWGAGTRFAPDRGYRPGVRMRWLGGDLRWLVQSLREPGRPDTLTRGPALGAFVRDFAVPARYDYVDVHDLRPVRRAVSDLAVVAAGRLVSHKRSGAADR